jgi:hypothetical protein
MIMECGYALTAMLEVNDGCGTDESRAQNVRHSRVTTMWGTPTNYVTMAREALGGRIALDPMSSHEFNHVVQAERIYTAYDDAFQYDWKAETVLLNPPGGRVVPAWRKLVDAYFTNDVGRAIWIGFSVEQLCLLAHESSHPMDFSWLLPRRRIPFRRHDGYVGSPSHANYVIGIGVPHSTFADVFGGEGKIGSGDHAIHEVSGAKQAA